MEKLKKTLEKMDPAKIKELQKIIGASGSTSKSAIPAALMKLGGINSVLSSLRPDELQIFSFISTDEEGRTFSEIEKATGFDIATIESVCDNLKDKLLIYIFKNRKHLNNRFDKVYLYEPIYNIVNHFTSKDINEQLISSKPRQGSDSSSIKIKDKKEILKTIYNHGGIISLNNLQNDLDLTKYDQILTEFEEKGYIKINLKLTYPFATIILLSNDTMEHYIETENIEGQDIFVKNGYSLLVNTLYISDIIRSNGLYLTQQNHFRKTDLKKLHMSVIEMQTADGLIYDVEESTQLSLYLLYLLETLEITKTNVFFSIEPISKLMHMPHKMLSEIIKRISGTVGNDNFKAPLQVPTKKDIEFCVTTLRKKSIPANLLFAYYLHRSITPIIDTADNIDNSVDSLRKSFDQTINFLVLCGIIDIKKGLLSISDTLEAPATKEPKTVFINPDFSMIIPKLDTSAYAQYILLSFSSITKNDVIINAKITKESVLHAYKRGFKTETVITILEKVSANTLPQNMSFLINEWIQQTLKIDINYGILLEVNHAAFLDELDFKHKDTVIRRVSDTCAIVKKETIDEIIRLGEKHKAIIELENIT